MVRITKVEGKGGAKFVQPVRARAVLRWSESELQILIDAIERELDLHTAAKLLPHRSFNSVKDKFYRLRGWSPDDYADELDVPPSLSDARRQKDAREGSEKLYEAIVKAGLFVPPITRKIA